MVNFISMKKKTKQGIWPIVSKCAGKPSRNPAGSGDVSDIVIKTIGKLFRRSLRKLETISVIPMKPITAMQECILQKQ